MLFSLTETAIKLLMLQVLLAFYLFVSVAKALRSVKRSNFYYFLMSTSYSFSRFLKCYRKEQIKYKVKITI